MIDAQGMTQNAITSDATSDQVIILNALDLQELERLLDPARFVEWMLVLPDRRYAVEFSPRVGKAPRPNGQASHAGTPRSRALAPRSARGAGAVR